MGLIWDDETIERAKKQDKETKWVWVISLLFFGIVSTIMLPEINYLKIILLTLSGAIMVVGIYGYIYKTTHFRIPDDLDEEEKRLIRLLLMVLGIVMFCLAWIGKGWI